MAGATSCSYAANVAVPRAFSMLGTFLTASGFSTAASAPGLLISQRWATGGIARRVASKSYAPGSNGKRWHRADQAARDAQEDLSAHFRACSPTTRLLENRARATFENTGQISTALICGGSVETGLWRLVDGRSANLHRSLMKRSASSSRAALNRERFSRPTPNSGIVRNCRSK